MSALRHIAGVAIVALSWEVMSLALGCGPHGVPGARAVILSVPGILANSGFWKSAGHTVAHVVVVMLVASILGTLVGYLMGRHPGFRGTVGFGLDFVRSIPAILLYYFVIGLIGLSAERKAVFLGLYLALPMATYVSAAIRETHFRYGLVGRALRLDERTYRRRVLFPGAAASLVGACRVLLSWTIVLVLVFELFTSAFPGIGSFVYSQYESLHLEALGATLVLVGIVGYLVNLVLALTEKLLSASRAAAGAPRLLSKERSVT